MSPFILRSDKNLAVKYCFIIDLNVIGLLLFLQASPPVYPNLDLLDAQTESNHDTALTMACVGGHIELVRLLLTRGANIEHRDKKGNCYFLVWSKDSSNEPDNCHIYLAIFGHYCILVCHISMFQVLHH